MSTLIAMHDPSLRLTESPAIAALRTSPRAYETVAAELEVLIRAGHFAVGDRLPSERQLASRFGVSRPTIRVALSQLESRGLVVTRSGSGTFVAERDQDVVAEEISSDDNPAEVLEARLAFEVAAARLAARRAHSDREGLENLRRAVEALERVASPEEMPVEIDADFHRGVAELTGNPYLARLLEPVWATMEQALLATLLQRSWSSDDTRRTAGEHRAIYEALRVGDPELAAFAMERHLRSLIAAMFEDGAFDGPPPRFYA
jgi:DNA-binding FadR family transcriptional regulator